MRAEIHDDIVAKATDLVKAIQKLTSSSEEYEEGLELAERMLNDAEIFFVTQDYEDDDDDDEYEDWDDDWDDDEEDLFVILTSEDDDDDIFEYPSNNDDKIIDNTNYGDN